MDEENSDSARGFIGYQGDDYMRLFGVCMLFVKIGGLTNQHRQKAHPYRNGLLGSPNHVKKKNTMHVGGVFAGARGQEDFKGKLYPNWLAAFCLSFKTNRKGINLK